MVRLRMEADQMNDQAKVAVISAGVSLITASTRLLQMEHPIYVAAGVAACIVGGAIVALGIYWVIHQAVEKAVAKALSK